MPSDDDLKTGRQLRSVAQAVSVGTVLQKRYQLLERLGAGGMGEAWKAADRDRRVNGHPAEVVIKLLPESLRQNKDASEDIRKEYSRVWLLSHPSICKLFDMGEQEGIGCFQVMQYLPGITLRRWLQTRQGVLLPELVLDILQATAEALDCAHTAETPVVHRDIKPENIMFNPETRKVHVIDFGLAAEIRTTHARYSRGHLPVEGTAAYMAPEQWHGRPLTAVSDQWALGIVAWELLTGFCPFQGSGMALGFAIINGSLTQLPPELQRLQPVFDRVLQKEPDRRYSRCVDFVQTLRTAFAADTAQQPPSPQQKSQAPEQPQVPSPPAGRTASPATVVAPAEEDLAS
ncbi:MAG: serine/threonine protein kinase, partial [Planctomycetota bacterium]